jgi:hypothetical protein
MAIMSRAQKVMLLNLLKEKRQAGYCTSLPKGRPQQGGCGRPGNPAKVKLNSARFENTGHRYIL